MNIRSLVLILAIGGAALAQSPDVQFRAAQQKETVDGDLSAAIRLYRQVADGRTTPPALAARALVRVGVCYERQGSTEAGKAYQRVLTQFGKEEAAAEARTRLASLPGKSGSETPEPGLVTRKLFGDLQFLNTNLTRDGRYTLLRSGFGLDLLDLVAGSRKPIRKGAPLVSAGEFSRGPYVISPDGHQFAFFVTVPNRGEMRVADIDGGPIRTLASRPNALKIQPLDWSADGHTILASVFSLNNDSDEFLLMDAAGQGVRSIRVSGNIGGQAKLSPDKEWIAFEKRRPESNQEGRFDELWRGNLFIIRVDGSGERQLVQREEAVSIAAWAPDGSSVLFVSEDLGTDHLWAVPVKDGNAASTPVSVMKGFSPVKVVGITPQGALLYSTGSWGTRSVIVKLDGPGGALSATQPAKPQPRRLGLSPAWSPDGHYLSYFFSEALRMTGAYPPSIVMVRDLTSGQERELGRFPFVGRRLSWTPDSKGLVFPARTAEGRNVIRLDLASGKTEPLIPAGLLDAQAAPSYPRISPDGKYLYYLQGVPYSSGVAARLLRLDLAHGQARQLATVHQFFDLSPNGNELIAPVADEAKRATVLRVMGSNAETLRDLVTLDAPEAFTAAEWSPDGRQVYFSRTISGNTERMGLFRVPAEGGKPVLLGEKGAFYPDIRLHPSGSEMAYVDWDSRMEVWKLEGLPQALTRALRSPRDEGLIARKVLGNLPPDVIFNTLTHDGRYTLVKAGNGVELLDVATGQRLAAGDGARLFSNEEVSPGMAYLISPDGRQFAFEISAPGRGELRVASIDGATVRTLASIEGKLKIAPLDWSRDGRTILAVPMTIKPEPDELLLVDASGKGSHSVHITGRLGKRAKLSPDGKWIAFERARNEQVQYSWRGDLWIIRADGSGERQLVQQAATTALAGWSPDGGSVLFVSEQSGVDHLWAVPVKAGAAMFPPVSIVKGFSHAGVLGTTPDGALLYSSGSIDAQAFTASLNAPEGPLSGPQPISARSRGMTASPTWSPDGRYLCYSVLEQEHPGEFPPAFATAIVREVSSGREREVGRFPRPLRRISWTSDSKSLIVPAATELGNMILRVDVETGRSEPLMPVAAVDSYSFYAFPQMSPDGRYLYYAQGPPVSAARLMRLDLMQKQVRQLATINLYFSMSPDGSAFVAPVVDKDKTVLRILGPEGEARRDLTTVSAPDTLLNLAWSADGREVFFARTIGGKQMVLLHVPASGGSPVPLSAPMSFFSDLSVHPNGYDLAFMRRTSDLEIWRLEGFAQAVARALQTPRRQAAQVQAKK